MKGKTAKAVFCATLGNIFWGFSFLFIRVCLNVAPNPNVMLSHRFLLSALLMGFWILIGKGKFSLKGKNWKPLVILLITQIGYYVFETYGLLYTNTTIAGMVLAVTPVVTIATGALFLREYPTLRQALFCIMPVAGVIIMTVSGKELGVVTTVGIILLLLTVVDSAIFKTANRKAAEEFSPFERSFSVICLTAIFFLFLAFKSVDWDIKTYFAPVLNGKYSLCILSLSVLCSIVAGLLVNYASGHMSVFKVSSFGALSTLCSAFAGVVFLKEPVNWTLLLGAVLILVGVHQVTKPKKQ